MGLNSESKNLSDGITLEQLNRAYYELEQSEQYDQWTLEKAAAVVAIRRLSIVESAACITVYIVTHRGGYRASLLDCSCPAHTKKGDDCKHMYAVALVLEAKRMRVTEETPDYVRINRA